MERTTQLRESDLRKMIRLAGEMGEIPRDGGRRIVYLLDGIRPLLEVRIAAWYANFTAADGQRYLHTVVDRGWNSPAERDGYARYIAADLAKDPLYDPFERWYRAGQPNDSMITHWREHFAANEYERHPYVNELLRPNGLDELLVYCRRTDRPGVSVGLALIRERGDDRPFTAREKVLVDLMYTSCAHLIEDAVPRPGLSPRAGQVLDCLLEGDSVKQVARRMGLSPHTVSDHVKAIYRRYGVASRAELLARFVRA